MKNRSIVEKEENLLLVLFSLKSGLTYNLLGLVTGLDGSSIKRHLDVGLNSITGL